MMYHTSPPRQVVLAGERDALEPMLKVLHRRFLPFHSVLWSDSRELNPELRNLTASAGPATAYVCENFTCRLPTADASQFAELLQ
jgi:uncharacterized protein YyaL (SSP411 family)